MEPVAAIAAASGSTMAGMNESEVLAIILERVRSSDPRVLLGPGDDLAHIQAGDGSDSLLVGVDQVIDGLHVLADRVAWDRIGAKAINRALSDVAAMAGRPLATLASVILPAGASGEHVEVLCDGLHAAAEKAEAPLIGGDIAIHRVADHPLAVSATVLASPIPPGPVRRTGALAGDRLVVTGCLGGSRAADGTGHHLDFRPRISEAAHLRKLLGAELHAMIDISDGLGRDAGRLAAAGGLQVHIQADTLPRRGQASVAAAMGDGEDYELLMAVGPGANLPEIIQSVDGPCPVAIIGRFVAISPDRHQADPRRVTLIDESGGEVDASECGWDHGQ